MQLALLAAGREDTPSQAELAGNEEAHRAKMPRVSMFGMRARKTSTLLSLAGGAHDVTPALASLTSDRQALVDTLAQARHCMLEYEEVQDVVQVTLTITCPSWSQARRARTAMRAIIPQLYSLVAASIQDSDPLAKLLTKQEDCVVNFPRRQAAGLPAAQQSELLGESSLRKLLGQLHQFSRRQSPDNVETAQELVLAFLSHHQATPAQRQPSPPDSPRAVDGTLAGHLPEHSAQAQCADDCSERDGGDTPASLHDSQLQVESAGLLETGQRSPVRQPRARPQPNSYRDTVYSAPCRGEDLSIGERARSVHSRVLQLAPLSRHVLSLGEAYGAVPSCVPADAVADPSSTRCGVPLLTRLVKLLTTPPRYGTGSGKPAPSALAELLPQPHRVATGLLASLPRVQVCTEAGATVSAVALPTTLLPSRALATPGVIPRLVTYEHSRRSSSQAVIRVYPQLGSLCGLAASAALLGQHLASLATTAVVTAATHNLAALVADAPARATQLVRAYVPATAGIPDDSVQKLALVLGDALEHGLYTGHAPTREWSSAEFWLVLALHGLTAHTHHCGDPGPDPFSSLGMVVNRHHHWYAIRPAWQRADAGWAMCWFKVCSVAGITQLSAEELKSELTGAAVINIPEQRGLTRADGHEPTRPSWGFRDAAIRQMASALTELAMATPCRLQLAVPVPPPWAARPVLQADKADDSLPHIYVPHKDGTQSVVLMDWLRFDQAQHEWPGLPAAQAPQQLKLTQLLPKAHEERHGLRGHGPPPADRQPVLTVGAAGPGTAKLKAAFHNIGCSKHRLDSARLSRVINELNLDILALCEMQLPTGGTRATLRAAKAKLGIGGSWVVPMPETGGHTDVAVWLHDRWRHAFDVILAPGIIRTRAVAVRLRTASGALYLAALHWPPQPWLRGQASHTQGCLDWLSELAEKARREGAMLLSLADENDVASADQDYLGHADPQQQQYGHVASQIMGLGLRDLWTALRGPHVASDTRAATHEQRTRLGLAQSRKDVIRYTGRAAYRTLVTNFPVHHDLVIGHDHSMLMLELWPEHGVAGPLPGRVEQWKVPAWSRMEVAVTTQRAKLLVTAETEPEALHLLERRGADTLHATTRRAGNKWEVTMKPSSTREVNYHQLVKSTDRIDWPQRSWERFSELLNERQPGALASDPVRRMKTAVDMVHQAGAAAVGYLGGASNRRRTAEVPRLERKLRAALRASGKLQRRAAIRAIRQVAPRTASSLSGGQRWPTPVWRQSVRKLLEAEQRRAESRRAHWRAACVRAATDRRRRTMATNMSQFLDSVFDRQRSERAELLAAPTGDPAELTAEPVSVTESLHRTFSTWTPPCPLQPPPPGWSALPSAQLADQLLQGGTAAARRRWHQDPEVDPGWLQGLLDPITPAELNAMLRSKTAPGLSGVSYQALRHAPEWVRSAMLDGCNHIMARPSSYPTWLGKGVIIPVPKDRQEQPMAFGTLSTANVRPITLQETAHKIMANAMMRRFMTADARHGIFPDSMVGFRRRRGTTEAVLAFQLAADLDRAAGRHFFELEVDISKAFDTARWPQIAVAMAAVRAPQAYTKLRHAMLQCSRVQVASFAGLSEPLSMDALLQGDPLSVVEYNALMRPLALRLQELQARDPTFLVALYADDIKVRARRRETLQLALDYIQEHLALTGQRVSPTKTVLRHSMHRTQSGLVIAGTGSSTVRTRVAGPNDVTRYLGTRTTPGGNTAETDRLLLQAVKALCNSVRPSSLTPREWRLAWQTVVVPKVAYVAALTPTSRDVLHAVDREAAAIMRKLGGSPGVLKLTGQRTHSDVLFTTCDWYDRVGAVGLGLRSTVDVVSRDRVCLLHGILNWPPPLLCGAQHSIRRQLCQGPTQLGGIEHRRHWTSAPAKRLWLGEVMRDLKALGATLAYRDATCLPHGTTPHKPSHESVPHAVWASRVAAVDLRQLLDDPAATPLQECQFPVPSGTMIVPLATKATTQEALNATAVAAHLYRHPTEQSHAALAATGTATLYADGGCNLKLGTMSAGCVLQLEDTTLAELSQPLARLPSSRGWAPTICSTAAELWAMALGVCMVSASTGLVELHIVSDSRAALAWLSQVKWRLGQGQPPLSAWDRSHAPAAAAIQLLADHLKTMLGNGTTISARWTKAHVDRPNNRDQRGNARADALATAALTKATTMRPGAHAAVYRHLEQVLLLPSQELWYQGPPGRPQRLRTASYAQPMLGSTKHCLDVAAWSARAIRVRAGTAWVHWQLPPGERSRSAHELRTRYPHLAPICLTAAAAEYRWQGGTMRSVSCNVESVLDAGNEARWRALATVLRGSRSQLAVRHALRCLTGNWGLPDQTNWQLQSEVYTDWSCPRCHQRKPSTPHLISCWFRCAPSNWWEPLVPTSEAGLRRAAKQVRRLQEAVKKGATNAPN